jgi:hypothetical protein
VSGEVLSIEEIRDAMRILRTVFDCITDLRKTSPFAQHINYPKLPPILTESLTVQLIRRGKILPEFMNTEVERGSRMADILIDRGRFKIEVKGTTAMSWVTLGKNDIVADYLVWIDFSNYFTTIFDNISVHVFKSPGAYSKMGKPILRRVLTSAGQNATQISLQLGEFLKSSGG